MTEANENSRLEAFCDGVFAIAITLLIIEIHVPPLRDITSTADLWKALWHIWPSFFAFILSFGIILITWVNHHSTIKLVNRSSPPFIYANGFLLLTIVVLPFPTAMLAEFGFTNYAAPAVVLYSSVNLLQSIAWILLTKAALKPHPLAKNDSAIKALRDLHIKGYFAMALYTATTIAAFWFPLTIAVIITLIWILWLIIGINIKAE